MTKEVQDATDFSGYDEFLRDIKSQIQTAQTQAALSLSRKVTGLYWRIGRGIFPPFLRFVHGPQYPQYSDSRANSFGHE